MSVTINTTAHVFRFSPDGHEYYLDDVHIPSITQLIEKGGLVTAQNFYTEASRDRGTAVHQACADYDLCALEAHDIVALPRHLQGYVAAYVSAKAALKPERMIAIEEADVHLALKFAGRTDRKWVVRGLRTVTELKAAAKAAHHRIQSALQAILDAPNAGLSPEHIQRMCIYLKPSGKFSIELHTDKRDLDTAYGLIRRFCQ